MPNCSRVAILHLVRLISEHLYVDSSTALSLSLYTAAHESCSYYGDVRLVNGSNEREGRLEVCIGKVWGTVCYSYYYWSYNFLRVACRQLGFEVDQGAGVFSDFISKLRINHSAETIWSLLISKDSMNIVICVVTIRNDQTISAIVKSQF